jgi:hypothetical protein
MEPVEEKTHQYLLHLVDTYDKQYPTLVQVFQPCVGKRETCGPSRPKISLQFARLPAMLQVFRLGR